MTAYNIAYSVARNIGYSIIGAPEESENLYEWTDETGAAMVDDANTPIIFTP